MSLEAALQENTAVMRELIAALTATGVLQNAQAMTTPAVQAVVRAQKDADVKKPKATDAVAETAPNACGEPSASTGASSSPETIVLQDWHAKTAELYAELKDAKPEVENLRKAILGINTKVSRAQAEAVLQRFGAEMITPKAGSTKKSLDEKQYGDFFKLCLRVLSGEVDATASIPEEA